jgi:hypothetical protein
MIRAIAIAACMALTGCVGGYTVHSYDLGCAASKNLYGDPALALGNVSTNYTGVTVNAVMHFAK